MARTGCWSRSRRRCMSGSWCGIGAMTLQHLLFATAILLCHVEVALCARELLQSGKPPPRRARSEECPRRINRAGHHCFPLSDDAYDTPMCTFAGGIIKAGRPLGTRTTTTGAECCSECAITPGCVYWTWLGRDIKKCRLFPDGQCLGFYRDYVAISGGRCNPVCEHDPHFVGARGTRFDFGGIPNKSFCLIADRHLHINVYLSGYYVQGALADGSNRTSKTWIRGVGILYGSHVVELWARSDPGADIRHGYMDKVIVDGEMADLVSLSGAGLGSASQARGGGGGGGGGGVSFPGDISIAKRETAVDGGFLADHYEVKIGTVLLLSATVRPAAPKWRTPQDSEIHLSLDFKHIDVSDNVHGVLGQTYRPDHADREAQVRRGKYNMTRGYLGFMQVDNPIAQGFLDGDVEDYLTSRLDSTDCRFGRFLAPAAVNDNDDDDDDGDSQSVDDAIAGSFNIVGRRNHPPALDYAKPVYKAPSV